MEYPKDCNTKDFQCSYPSCMCGNVETQPPQPTIGLTYEQLEQLYFTQCECTDEWADKYKLSQEENEKLIHDLSEYISIANISTTQLAQAQAEKAELAKDRDEWKSATVSANERFKIAEDKLVSQAELVRQCAEIARLYAVSITTGDGRVWRHHYGDLDVMQAILSLLPKTRDEG